MIKFYIRKFLIVSAWLTLPIAVLYHVFKLIDVSNFIVGIGLEKNFAYGLWYTIEMSNVLVIASAILIFPLFLLVFLAKGFYNKVKNKTSHIFRWERFKRYCRNYWFLHGALAWVSFICFIVEIWDQDLEFLTW